VRTTGAPPCGKLTATTSPRVLPTNSVPPAPKVIARALGTCATSSMRNPSGSLMRSSGAPRCARTPGGAASSAAKIARARRAMARRA
jgi:hypothetical protein